MAAQVSWCLFMPHDPTASSACLDLCAEEARRRDRQLGAHVVEGDALQEVSAGSCFAGACMRPAAARPCRVCDRCALNSALLLMFVRGAGGN